MISVTDTDIDRSYTILALVGVCRAASQYMEDQSGNNSTLSGHLTSTLRHVQELSYQTHDLLEKIQRQEAKP
ncbi:hypothetical protein [Phyllobacterium chamaecytisi]|uniref:hypothetical protein n=1 Tax=Phyllobacterium chamaecytisi TaxID=2876082 RepID=UPI001CCC5207|nr:hypothetical protein [Phyllobacterium sp. KW56]MBZ9603965.1 hypothetical protein [Phyllobacterium sp. KW56]